MTSKKDDGPSSKKTTGAQAGGEKNKPPMSAQARARAAKKAVTIDLEAKDVTPKPEADAPKSKDSVDQLSAKSDDKSASESTKDAKVVSSSAKENAKSSVPPTSSDKKTDAAVKDGASKDSVAKDDKAKAEKKSEAALSGIKEPSTASKPKKAAPPPPLKKAEKKSGGVMGSLVASIIGGFIAILGFIGLQLAGIVPSFSGGGNDEVVAQLETRLAELEKKPFVTEDALSPISERIATVEKTANAATETPAVPKEVAARLTALEARLADAEKEVNTSSTPTTDAPNVSTAADATKGIAERFAAIEARLSAAEGAGVAPDEIASLAKDLAALSERVNKADEAPAIDLSPLTAKVDGLAADVASIKSNAPSDTAPASAPAQDIASAAKDAVTPLIAAEVAKVEAAIAKVEGDSSKVSEAVAAVTSELSAVNTKLKDVSDKQTGLEATLAGLNDELKGVSADITAQAGKAADAQSAAKALAISNFRRVAQSGAPFSDELAALSAVGVESQPLTDLAAFAKDGLTSNEVLGTELTRLLAEAAAKTPAADGENEGKPLSAWDKFARNAQSLVKVRKIGEDASDDGPMGKLKAAFDAGDLAAFTETYGALTQPQKTLFNQWLVKWRGQLALTEALSLIKNADAVDETAPAENQ